MNMIKDTILSAIGKDTNALDQFIGNRVREERVHRGLTQQNLAALLGVTYQQAHKYERGINRISAARLFHIAQTLEISIMEFFPSAESPEGSFGGRQDLELAKNFGRLGSEHRDAVSRLVRALLPPDGVAYVDCIRRRS